MTDYKQVEFAGGWPKVVRFSRLLMLLRASGDPSADDTIETLNILYEKSGHTCTKHGLLDDPIVFTATVEGNDQLVLACSQCSDERLRKQWEAEAP